MSSLSYCMLIHTIIEILSFLSLELSWNSRQRTPSYNNIFYLILFYNRDVIFRIGSLLLSEPSPPRASVKTYLPALPLASLVLYLGCFFTLPFSLLHKHTQEKKIAALYSIIVPHAKKIGTKSLILILSIAVNTEIYILKWIIKNKCLKISLKSPISAGEMIPCLRACTALLQRIQVCPLCPHQEPYNHL